jgi:hypothetical protein
MVDGKVALGNGVAEKFGNSFNENKYAQQQQTTRKCGKVGFRSASFRSISLSCRTGNHPESASDV